MPYGEVDLADLVKVMYYSGIWLYNLSLEKNGRIELFKLKILNTISDVYELFIPLIYKNEPYLLDEVLESIQNLL
jgi:hypothetical protein